MTDSSSVYADAVTRSISRLALLFHDSLDELGTFDHVLVDALPDDCQTLLAHGNHMTVTLEAFHNSLVDVNVVTERQDDASYSRQSVLTRQSDGRIIQFGIMRIWLADLPADARDEIRSRSEPLGRILIRHNVLREVELMALWRIAPGPFLRHHLELDEGHTLFGRTAQIIVEDRPTVQLLEIVKT